MPGKPSVIGIILFVLLLMAIALLLFSVPTVLLGLGYQQPVPVAPQYASPQPQYANNSVHIASQTSPPEQPQLQSGQTINYFAYGSNFDEGILRGRTGGDFPKRQAAVLPNYSLFFSGPASIYEKQGSAVYGALYQLSEAQMLSLDGYEGVPTSYVRINVTVISGGKRIPAEAYQFASERDFSAPSEGYLQIIRTGYSDLGYPQEAFDLLNSAAEGKH